MGANLEDAMDLAIATSQRTAHGCPSAKVCVSGDDDDTSLPPLLPFFIGFEVRAQRLVKLYESSYCCISCWRPANSSATIEHRTCQIVDCSAVYQHSGCCSRRSCGHSGEKETSGAKL
ncbi:hypothetical protein GW17_00053239 [Ensete ventricosum]|nr:hypothetical protein GW17_00053239 [Ensete ventricosum]